MRMAEEFLVSRYLLTFPRQELYRTLLDGVHPGACLAGMTCLAMAGL
jgi:hypothetical protein